MTPMQFYIFIFSFKFKNDVMSHQICAFLVAKVTQTLISEEYKCKIE